MILKSDCELYPTPYSKVRVTIMKNKGG